jgi:3'-phosphoadenosine 5'-phosphosulfate sulfotransferase (PAPS reductase)/FAD synthetase
LDERARKTFLLWSKRPEFSGLVVDTTYIIRRTVERGKCCVAFSGGKDSTVMLHLALQVDSGIDVFLWDQGSRLMPREVHAEILDNAKKLGVKNLIVEAWAGSEAADMRVNPELWRKAHLAHYGIIGRTQKERGWQFTFVGLRREESCKRGTTIREHKRKGEVYPLENWSYLDVWGYIVAHNLPYPKLYDVYGPLLGWDQARFVNFFSGAFEKFGSPFLDSFFFPQYRNIGQYW